MDQEAKYVAAGYEVTEHRSQADIFIVRGCSVTRRAQSDCERLIAALKRDYPTRRLIIEGCLPRSVKGRSVDRVPQPAKAVIPTKTARAYLKVQDGCSGRCTFCIVPQFRGCSKSEGFEAVLDRAKRFIDAGYHELVVTGCNLSLYASEGRRLAQLVEALALLDPGVRVRVGSVEPGNAAHELVSVMKERANICRFLHIPVQSGSNRILTAMRRPYLVKDVESLVDEVVAMPLLGLGVDLMTGFPGETETDFLATQGLLMRLPIANAHVFPYSPRPRTIAASLPDALSHEVRHARARMLMKLMQQLRIRFARRFVSHEVEVLIEDAKRGVGWTGEYFKCKVDMHHGASALRRGEIVRATVYSTDNDKLLARPVTAVKSAP